MILSHGWAAINVKACYDICRVYIWQPQLESKNLRIFYVCSFIENNLVGSSSFSTILIFVIRCSLKSEFPLVCYMLVSQTFVLMRRVCHELELMFVVFCVNLLFLSISLAKTFLRLKIVFSKVDEQNYFQFVGFHSF